MRRCDSGEGMIFSNLDETIAFHVRVCERLQNFVRNWANEVFTGRISFSPESEAALKNEIQEVLTQARKVAQRAIELKGVCYQFEHLNLLCKYVLFFESQVENWISPKLSVSPAPRVTLSPKTDQEITENIKLLRVRSIQ